jgi:hypothetical protein
MIENIKTATLRESPAATRAGVRLLPTVAVWRRLDVPCAFLRCAYLIDVGDSIRSRIGLVRKSVFTREPKSRKPSSFSSGSKRESGHRNRREFRHRTRHRRVTTARSAVKLESWAKELPSESLVVASDMYRRFQSIPKAIYMRSKKLISERNERI